MFGGIISCIGLIRFTSKHVLVMAPTLFSADCDQHYFEFVKIGESIAINGVCLTVVEKRKKENDPTVDEFVFHVSPETLDITTLKFLQDKQCAIANVERPLRHGEFLGGHYVQGHVQMIGQICKCNIAKKRSTAYDTDGAHLQKESGDDYHGYDIYFNPLYWTPDIVYKGSVAINGVSLTVASVDKEAGTFSVTVIPHTLKNTTLDTLVQEFFDKRQKVYVNLEFPSNASSVSPLPVSPLPVSPSPVSPLSASPLPVSSVSVSYSTSPASSLPLTVPFYNVGKNVDEHFMTKALGLAEKGRYTAPPNPWVGCVLVFKNIVIGEGFHASPGSPHAEINAINDAENKGMTKMIEGCTVYVTLEPCHHYGRTPPCDQELVNRRVARVVVGCLDPDERVAGQGVAFLRAAGIQVDVLQSEVSQKVVDSLAAYIHHRKTQFPLVIGKIAISLDGSIQDAWGQSKWISDEESRSHAHELRAQCQAIIVGSETAMNDQPRLNVRLAEKQGGGKGNDGNRNDENVGNVPCPWRVVIDGQGRVPHTGPLFDLSLAGGKRTLIFTTRSDLPISDKAEIVQVRNVDGHVDLQAVLSYLAINKGVLQCLVEGGARLQSAFLYQGLIDEMYIYTSPRVLGSGSKRWGEYMPSRSVTEKSQLILKNSWATKQGDSIKHFLVDKKQKTGQMETPVNSSIDTLVDDPVREAIEAFKQGKMVLVVDDESRENEGDLFVPASLMTEEQMIFFLQHTTGLTCVAMDKDRATRFGLTPMCVKNQDNHGTAFTVTCDAIETGTGVSAKDRLATIHTLASEESDDGHYGCNKSVDRLRRPGHLLPLVARQGGLAVRRGHTEASVTLCELAGLPQVAVLSELQDHATGLIFVVEIQSLYNPIMQ